MEVSSQESNSECVLMPWDDETTIIISGCEGDNEAYSRWDLIQKQLGCSKISNAEELVNAIKSYNVVFAKSGQQEECPWKFPVLFQYFSQMDDLERKKMFEENGVISTIRNLSLTLKELLPRLKLLKTGFSSSLQLHQTQIASILSNAFFCTFPKDKADCPSINFNTLYEGPDSVPPKYYIEKLKCLMHYFKRIHKKQPSGNLTFHRLNIPDHKFPRWDKTSAGLCALVVDAKEKIEDQQGYLQMDFAHKYVGGGVLGRGCVQEEIRFLISPELISARLFTERLADNESLFVIGAERFSQYTGYSKTFAFAGDYEDTSPFDENEHKKTYLIILDAFFFLRPTDQYRESKILRELKKAYVGFRLLPKYNHLPLATGNWGCGAFGGNPQLKSIIQLMAASQACRNVLYLTFGNFQLKDQIEEFYHTLKKKAVNVGMLYRVIRLYDLQKKSNQTVFEFVIASFNESEECKAVSYHQKMSTGRSTQKVFLAGKSKPTPSTSRHSTAFEFFSVKEDQKIEKTNLGETLPEDFPDMDLDFEALDKAVEEKSKEYNAGLCSSTTHSNQSFSQQEIPSLIDMMWCEDDCNASTKEQHKPVTPEKRENSPGLISEDDVDIIPESPENSPSTEGSGLFSSSNEYQGFKSPFRTRNEMLCQGRHKKMVQSKITDCFKK